MARTKNTSRPIPKNGGKQPRAVFATTTTATTRSTTRTTIATVSKQSKSKWRFRAGTVALREIRQMQRTTNLLISRAPFVRLVREIVQDMTDSTSYRITPTALTALQVCFFVSVVLSTLSIIVAHYYINFLFSIFFIGSVRELSRLPDGACQFMRHPRQTSHSNGERHSVGETHSWRDRSTEYILR